MHTKSARNPNYNQLDLLKDLFKADTRETIFIGELLEELKNFTYIKRQTLSSEISKEMKVDLEMLLDYILWSLSGYLYDISRYNEKYRDLSLEDFRKKTESPNWVSTFEVPDLELIQGYFERAEARLRGLFIGFKELSKGHNAPQETLDYLRKANLLLY